jgi:hypothetical protein
MGNVKKKKTSVKEKRANSGVIEWQMRTKDGRSVLSIPQRSTSPIDGIIGVGNGLVTVGPPS